ncbi:MAG: hypothetical protein PHR86_12540, partial [Desulfobacterales bacterium]|nr:hypothetical protein [Desulfobacterales bacterium]
DRIFRLGKDPIRKLALEDRLTGAAKLAADQGLSPTNLAWGMAEALRFNPADDPAAQMLQKRIAEAGVETAFLEVSGLTQKDPLTAMVLKAYAELEKSPRQLPCV